MEVIITQLYPIMWTKENPANPDYIINIMWNNCTAKICSLYIFTYDYIYYFWFGTSVLPCATFWDSMTSFWPHNHDRMFLAVIWSPDCNSVPICLEIADVVLRV